MLLAPAYSEPPLRIFGWGQRHWAHNFTVPAKLMGLVFISEGAVYPGVITEYSSRNHPRSMSSCRQGGDNRPKS